MLRPQFHPIHEMEPFAMLQGADAGDVACNPFDIMESIGARSSEARTRCSSGLARS